MQTLTPAHPARATPTDSPAPSAHRVAAAWLVLSAIAGVFANGRWVVPVAAWLLPVALLHFVRRTGWRAAVVAYLVQISTAMVAWLGLVPLPAVWYAVTVASIQTVLFVPYVFDRWLSRALGRHRLVSTLAFPAAAVGVEYLLATLSPWGTWCLSAYAQDDLRLLQLLAITGMWGITFLVTWLASVVDLVWEELRAGQRPWRALAAYAGVALAVYAYGAVRLRSAPPVPVTQIEWLASPRSTASREYWRYVDRLASRGSFDFDLPATDFDRLGGWMANIRDDMLALTEHAAQGGARLVFWPEAEVPVFGREVAGGAGREEVLAGARRIAAEWNVYVGVTLDVVHPSPVRTENEIVLVAPSGATELDYHKAHPVFPVETAVSIGQSAKVTVATTAIGRLSAAICHDFDFHRLFFDAGRGGAELVLDPSGDWEALYPLHSHMARFRAIEQGFSLVRGVTDGLAFACDGLGQVVAAVDTRRGKNGVMPAAVPVRAMTTLYTRIGDMVAWACLALVGVMAGAAAWRRVAGDSMNRSE